MPAIEKYYKIKVELKNKHLANCQKCGRMGAECFTTTIEEYDIYEKNAL